MKYSIWMSGWTATGMEGYCEKAQFLGEYDASSFVEECKKWANEEPSRLESFSIDRYGLPNYWGCGPYNNEEDARKLERAYE